MTGSGLQDETGPFSFPIKLGWVDVGEGFLLYVTPVGTGRYVSVSGVDLLSQGLGVDGTWPRSTGVDIDGETTNDRTGGRVQGRREDRVSREVQSNDEEHLSKTKVPFPPLQFSFWFIKISVSSLIFRSEDLYILSSDVHTEDTVSNPRDYTGQV